MRIALLTLLLATSICQKAKPQSLFLHFFNGALVAYDLSKIRKITFENDLMLLHKEDGSTVSWNVEEISKYTFLEPTNVIENFNNEETLNLIVFPNPSTVKLTLELSSLVNEKITIEVFNAEGKNICELFNGEVKDGNNITFTWNRKDRNNNIAANGMYYCRVSFSKGFINKPILLQ
jgi:hypothetical protein